MRSLIAKTMNLYDSQVNIKSTTSDGLGFIGAGEGIAALAVATIGVKK